MGHRCDAVSAGVRQAVRRGGLVHLWVFFPLVMGLLHRSSYPLHHFFAPVTGLHLDMYWPLGLECCSALLVLSRLPSWGHNPTLHCYCLHRRHGECWPASALRVSVLPPLASSARSNIPPFTWHNVCFCVEQEILVEL